ncbi:pyrroline-5-carboxylate reductase [Copidosoma floridanum]|uniref:pyrroline-5-carboxylate reductase n=1 Tax=Copidosoma floridanum TaxID=29053 RepID=UPI0006C9E2AD|nr:pyrroline-5-carboxylate reductase [Copidosoma floridanum]XP_014204046.1 pyrroline-5-carboxylate reductase [Copidosoma floridanum]XP_014204047.1 pyrroline-5-carboxylate reductase [Copidosoma floridanum]
MADSDLLQNKIIGFIGGGNMAQAIGMGILKKGIIKPNNIWISSRTEKTLSIWKNVGANTTFKNYEVVQKSDIILLCVKPQLLNEALETSIPPSNCDQEKLFISVIVGVTLAALQAKLSKIVSKPRIVRSMPNTPLLVSEGITVYCSSLTTENDEAVMKLLFSSTGICEKIQESLMNSAGALTGSGPAYGYMIVEALADGAVRRGIPRETATKFAAQVLVGAGKMILQTEKHPGQLKDEVCSPNGSTIAGVHALESGAVRASLMNAIAAAASRSDELSSSTQN